MHAAVVVPQRGGVVRLDIALMDGCRIEGALDDDVGLGEAFLAVADLPLEMLRDVRGGVGLLPVFLGFQVVVQQRGIAAHGLRGGHRRAERLVFDLDQFGGLLGDVEVDRGDCGYGVALVERLAVGQDVAVDVRKPGIAFADIDDLVPGGRQVGGRGYREYAVERLGFRGVDGDDSSMGVRAAQDEPMQQPGELLVRSVERAAGNLVGAVVAHRARADHVVGAGRQHHVGLVCRRRMRSVRGAAVDRGFGLERIDRRTHARTFCCSRQAAACTERTILS